MKVIYTLLMAIALLGCSKFEDGNNLSLRNKTTRLCHDWESADKETPYNIQFKEDGKFQIQYSGVLIDGTWEWDKTNIKMVEHYYYLTTDKTYTFEVKELRRDKLHYHVNEYTFNGSYHKPVDYFFSR